MKNLHKGSDELMDYFIQNHTIKATNGMPLLSFVGAMYPSNLEDEKVDGLDWLVTQIEQNLEKKYEEITVRESEMKKAQEAAAMYKNSTWKDRERAERDGWRRDRDRGDQRHRRDDSRDRHRDRDRDRDKHRDDSGERKKKKSKSRSR